MKLIVKSIILFSLILATVALPLAAEGSQEGKKPSLAVFVPGVAAGSPTYEKLVSGTEKAAAEKGYEVKILEGGFNQAEWENKVMSLAAAGEYDFIVTSNTSMPAICKSVSEKIPGPRYICADGFIEGASDVFGALYNQREQGYMAGYAAGLATVQADAAATRAGAIIAQHYPIMDEVILKAFEEGFQAVIPGGSVEVRVVGNWYDAGKGTDLATTLYDQGIQVILPISGGANQGILKAAMDKSRYVVWFDSDNSSAAPNTIIASAVLNQDKLVHELVSRAVDGDLDWGKSEIKNTAGGYIDLIVNDGLRAVWNGANLSAMESVIEKLRAGELELPLNYDF